MKQLRSCLGAHRVFWWAFSLTALATAIPASARSLRAQTQNGHSSDQAAFAAIAEREILQLRDGITLAQWIHARGTPEGWAKTPERKTEPTDWPTSECLSYVRKDVLPSGAEVKRAAYFYPPAAPSPAIFPRSRGQELINNCVLAVVRVEAEAETPETGHALDQAVRRRVSEQFGGSIGTKNVPFWGLGLERYGARWIHKAEIVSGVDREGALVPGPVAFAGSRLPLAHKLELNAAKEDRYRSIENLQFYRAVALVGANQIITARFKTLYAQIFRAGAGLGHRRLPGDIKWRAWLLPVLRDWLDALEPMAPAQHAAGLLAADRFLDAADTAGRVPGWPQKPGKRTELQELGAAFEMNGIAGNYYYVNNWEKQAGSLDPNGTVGIMATLGSMARGSCDTDNNDPFRKVILNGQNLLSNRIDPSTAALVHFMIGDAYSAMITIAAGESGANGEYDPDQFRADAETNRAKALAHYRAGLAVDNTSLNAKDAWSQAWRLSAGLLPNQRYVCFGD